MIQFRVDLLAAIDNDILWKGPGFQHALFGMVASPSEQTGRLDLEVSDLLLVAVHKAEPVLLLNLISFQFLSLKY
jgi:hypothetical protein